MIFRTDDLLEDLSNTVKCHALFIKSLTELPHKLLQQKRSDDSWSVLECIAHLNLYGNFYLPEIKYQMDRSKYPYKAKFKSGFFGNKFAEDMLPKEQMKTMKTFKSKDPIHSSLDGNEVLNEFLKQQRELLVLLDIAKTKDLTKIKTSLTIPLLRFRLGDTFRFVINHNERHIVQAKRVLSEN